MFFLLGLAVLCPMAVYAVICVRVSRARNEEAHATVAIDGRPVELASAVWAAASNGAEGPVTDFLTRTRAKTAQGTADGVSAVIAALPASQRAAITDHQQVLARARADRQLWAAQTDVVAGAAAAGALDGVVIALGENPDWVAHHVSQLMSHVDLSQLLSGELVHHAARGAAQLAPDLTSSLVDHLDHALAPMIDHAADAVGDALLGGVTAVADAHLPLFTLARSLRRAKVASDAGLEQSRVTENLLLDAGATGGATAAGAVLGSFIVPGLGTVVGGMLGGFVGRAVAQLGKERHLMEAQRLAERRLQDVGRKVPSTQWRAMSADLTQCLRRADASLLHLQGALRHHRRRLRPARLGVAVLGVAAETGAADLRVQLRDLHEWNRSIEETAGSDAATFRGVMVTTRPDLAERFAVPASTISAAVEANEAVREERRKLALA